MQPAASSLGGGVSELELLDEEVTDSASTATEAAASWEGEEGEAEEVTEEERLAEAGRRSIAEAMRKSEELRQAKLFATRRRVQHHAQMPRTALRSRPSLHAYLPEDAPVRRATPKVRASIAEFDARHAVRTRRAHAAYTALGLDPTSHEKEAAFDQSLAEVRQNKFFVRDHLGVTSGLGASDKKAKSQWRLETSIWAPRLKTSDSRAFYDSEHVRRTMFEHDWSRAKAAHQLEKYILRNSTGKSTHDDGSTEWDEVAQVGNVLWEHQRTVYSMFGYYACQGASDNIFSILLNGFLAWIDDCSIAVKGSVRCQKGDLDQLFIQINAGGGGEGDAHNELRALNRQEFLQCLVRTSILKYVESGSFRSASDALRPPTTCRATFPGWTHCRRRSASARAGWRVPTRLARTQGWTMPRCRRTSWVWRRGMRQMARGT